MIYLKGEKSTTDHNAWQLGEDQARDRLESGCRMRQQHARVIVMYRPAHVSKPSGGACGNRSFSVALALLVAAECSHIMPGRASAARPARAMYFERWTQVSSLAWPDRPWPGPQVTA